MQSFGGKPLAIEIDSENSDLDLTSTKTVLTHTPSTTRVTRCQAVVYVGDGTKDHAAAADDWELTLVVDGNDVQPAPQIITSGAASTRSAFATHEFIVPANAVVLLKLKSPNVGDSDVDVTGKLYEVR